MVRATAKGLVASAALVLAAVIAGFFIFASFTTRELGDVDVRADAIVVLTGGPNRIRSGADLLRAKRGRRLLVSGANERTPARDIWLLSGLSRPMFDCCVDVGYQARDTIGNATETRDWANSNKFQSLIVVTSRFHMPRSLAELARALPDVTLKPYPVAPADPAPRPWWQDRGRAQALIGEYLKFLPAAARYAISYCFETRNGRVAAEQRRDLPPTTTRNGTGSS